jgi:hypothetical protein
MSFIGNEFSGLPIADLIGGPLKAACDAQVRLAKATADFITTVGFNPDIDPKTNTPTGKLIPRNVDFSFWKPVAQPQKEVLATGSVTLTGTKGSVTSVKVNGVEILGLPVPFNGTLQQTATDVTTQINKFHSSPAYTASSSGATITISAEAGSGASANGFAIVVTGSGDGDVAAAQGTLAGGVDGGGDTKVQKVVLSVPFLAIVNVPSLMVKTVDVVFDMEVKESETHHDAESQELSIDVTAKVGWGPFSAEVKIHGAISAHQENTRSTDRSAKYHVQVHASDDGMPEGLSRVLDILQKAIAPVSASKAIDLQTAGIAQNQKPV